MVLCMWVQVPKSVTPPKKYPNNTYRELDPRGAFIVHTPQHIWVWQVRRQGAQSICRAATIWALSHRQRNHLVMCIRTWQGLLLSRPLASNALHACWLQGALSPPAYLEQAQRHAALLQRYEAPTAQVRVIQQGCEPSLFVALMDPPALDPEAERINARRASITGEIPMALAGTMHMDM